MKAAPVVRELARRSLHQIVVHTEQHYDAAMSAVFFEELGLPEPTVHLGARSDTQARQTAAIMTSFDEVCDQRRPSLVLVFGDVNSTVAAALVAAKRTIPIAHIEAGLRSFDRNMPEEINRVVTDHLSDFLFTTEESANQNLQHEGIDERRVHFVGNCMVDTLVRHLPQALELSPWRTFHLAEREYALVTLHRPSNVDNPEALGRHLVAVSEISRLLPVLFPVHPRTRTRLSLLGLTLPDSVVCCDPLPYLTFLGLMAKARLILTDSGGIQEESTALRVPCLTLRNNTERPITISMGSNCLVGTDPARICEAAVAVLRNGCSNGSIPPLWDGHAGVRIVDALAQHLDL